MPATIDATVGGVSSNSFGLLTDANTYFTNRVPLASPWEDYEFQNEALITSTRLIVASFKPTKVLIHDKVKCCSYYLIKRTWTGLPTTTTQRLPFPRTGMYDNNGNAIADNVIPLDLKEAQFELAGRLSLADLTLDNDIAVQGIKSVKAGSVAVAFKDDIASTKLIPDYVFDLLPASWFTDEIIQSAFSPLFEVL